MIDMDGLDYIIVLKFAVRWWTRSFLLLSPPYMLYLVN
jgi:hypothetical protein